MKPVPWSYLFLILFSLVLSLCWALIWFLPKFTSNVSDAHFGIQTIHEQSTLRLGGIAVYFAFSCGAFVLSWAEHSDIGKFSYFLAVGLFPLVLVGLLEDVTAKISPIKRLLAAGLSATLTSVLLDASVYPTEIPLINRAIESEVLLLLITVICVSALTNSINMMDGCNGFASGYALVTLPFFYIISLSDSNSSLALLILLLMACIAGFWVVNWPFGWIFLGDNGAYFVGASLAWVTILVAQQSETMSNSATLLFLVYPAWELISTIVRRLRRGTSLMHPDNGHLHSLLFRFLLIVGKNRCSVTLINSATSAVLLGVVLLFNLLAFFIVDDKVTSLRYIVAIILLKFLLLTAASLSLQKKV